MQETQLARIGQFHSQNELKGDFIGEISRVLECNKPTDSETKPYGWGPSPSRDVEINDVP